MKLNEPMSAARYGNRMFRKSNYSVLDICVFFFFCARPPLITVKFNRTFFSSAIDNHKSKTIYFFFFSQCHR